MYYKITLIRPYINDIVKISKLENVIDNQSFPIYATLSGIISSPETNQEGIYFYRDIVSGEKIYSKLQSEKLKGRSCLFYEDVEEISSTLVKEDLEKLKPYIYNYLNSLNEFKQLVIKDYVKNNNFNKKIKSK